MNTIIKSQNRREFIKSSALIGAFLSLDPFSLAYGNTVKLGDLPILKERLLPVSITWDAANLMMKDKNISWKMMDSISEQFNKMVSGKVLEKGKKFIPDILDIIHKGGAWSEEIHPKVALVAGWLIYREVVPIVTPLYKHDTSTSDVYNREIAILKYKIAREIGGKVSKEEMEDILKLMFHRATFRTHTITPDREDWENWVVRYIDWYEQDRKGMGALAEAWVNGNDATDKSFFNPDDELIKIANDYSIWKVDLNESFLEGKGDSLYAKALSNATKAIKHLDEYFKGNMDKNAFMKKVNIA